MRAVRVQRYDRRHVVHWVDDGWTLCGRRLAALGIVDDLYLDELPVDEGCAACDEIARRPIPSSAPRSVYNTAEPARGRLRTVGPLAHGTRAHRVARWL